MSQHDERRAARRSASPRVGGAERSPDLEGLRSRARAAAQASFEADLIDVEELEARLELAKTSTSPFELEGLAGRGPRPLEADARRGATGSEMVALPERGTTLAVLGASTKAGAWRVPQTLTAVAAVGSVTLDLREAVLGPRTELRVFAALGRVEVVVPPEVRVEANGVGVLGTFGQGGGSGSTSGSLIRISGWAVLGSVEITVRGADGSVLGELWRRVKKSVQR